MPTAFVTGSNGFVGLSIVEKLVAEGWDVTAMHRANSDITFLERFPVRRVVADLADAARLEDVVPHGLDAMFHVAGDISYWSGNRDRQTVTNVVGTRNIVATALRRQVARFVHTSTISVYGHVSGVIDESTPTAALLSRVHYAETKWLAEEEVRSAMGRGLDAVIFRPAGIMGRYDRHGFARIITLVAESRLPGVPDVTVDFCSGAEVAAAQVRAATGQTRDLYVLGGTRASFLDVARLAASRTGGKAPARPTPLWALRLLGAISEGASRVTHREPEVTTELVRSFGADTTVDVTRAVDDLGFQTATIESMVAESVGWLRGEGFLAPE